MADSTVIEKECWDIVQCTEGIHLMPFINNYGQEYPAVYFDRFRPLYNGDTVAFTFFVLHPALQKEYISDVQQELGRQVSENEMESRHRYKTRGFQQNSISPICIYLIKLLTGKFNANLPKESAFPYKFRKGRQMTIDDFSVLSSGELLPFYEALVTQKGLIGVAYDIEVEGGSSLYPTLPANLKTNFDQLAAIRKQQRQSSTGGGNTHQSGGIHGTQNLILPKGAIVINRQNFTNSTYRAVKNHFGKEMIAVLGKWHRTVTIGNKTRKADELLTVMGYEGGSLHKQGSTYYLMPSTSEN